MELTTKAIWAAHEARLGRPVERMFEEPDSTRLDEACRPLYAEGFRAVAEGLPVGVALKHFLRLGYLIHELGLFERSEQV